jgi:hypothetical protein
MNREERKAWLERRASMTKQENDAEELKRIKAYVYGFGKNVNRTDTRWLIEMAEKAIKAGL